MCPLPDIYPASPIARTFIVQGDFTFRLLVIVLSFCIPLSPIPVL